MKVLASCHISPKGAFVNNAASFSVSKDSEDWKKEIYRHLDVEYPKFHKMDALAKMAFLATELLGQTCDLTAWGEDDLALIFANSHSSHDTDMRFIESYTEKGNPGPSLFVYTLPNILTGELAIRHKWYGESIFFILEKFDAGFYIDQINFYFRKGAKACLCGWVESVNGREVCVLFLATPEEGEISETELLNILKHT